MHVYMFDLYMCIITCVLFGGMWPCNLILVTKCTFHAVYRALKRFLRQNFCFCFTIVNLGKQEMDMRISILYFRIFKFVHEATLCVHKKHTIKRYGVLLIYTLHSSTAL